MADALQGLGHQVVPFAWHTYVTRRRYATAILHAIDHAAARAQNKYLVGPLLRRINADLVRVAGVERPDVLFVYRGTHITGATLEAVRLRSPHTVIVGYNNDDPFAPSHPRAWRHFIEAVPHYDLVLAYREHNIADYLRAGARRTGLLRSWFDPAVHRPVSPTEAQRASYGCDAVFVGHFEDDGRLDVLERLAAAGLHVRIFGPGSGIPGSDWNGVLMRSTRLRALAPTRYLQGDEYAAALSCAKIALCFLSKRNRDTYTRRCFEIPAVGTLLLSEHSPDLETLYREGLEADFFRSPSEAVSKATAYLGDDERRRQVARAGHTRAISSGYDVTSRMRDMLEQVRRLRAGCETARA